MDELQGEAAPSPVSSVIPRWASDLSAWGRHLVGVRLNLNLALGMAVFILMGSWGVSVPGEAGSSFSGRQSPDLCSSFCPQLHPSVSGLAWPAVIPTP